jgi:hypothetical protein
MSAKVGEARGGLAKGLRNSSQGCHYELATGTPEHLRNSQVPRETGGEGMSWEVVRARQAQHGADGRKRGAQEARAREHSPADAQLLVTE